MSIICNLSTLEGEAGDGGSRSGVQGQSQLCRVAGQPDLRDQITI